MSAASPFAHLPGPAPTPVIGWRGNLLRFVADPIGYMAPLARTHGELVSFAAGGAGPVLIREASPRSAVFALGPACNQAVYGQSSVFHSTRFAGPPESRSFHRLTAGLFSMNDDRHHRQRRLILPAFHKKRLESYRDVMISFTERMMSGWRTGETLDLSRDLQRLTLSVADKTLFGRDPTPGAISLGEQIQDVVTRAISPSALIPLNLPLTPRRRLVDASARLEDDLRAVIAEKRAAGGDGDDVIAMLLATRDEEGASLTEDELIGQLFILFFAGHDTTQNALAWTLFLLSQHGRVLRDLVDELEGVLRGAAPTAEQLTRLPLLDRVFKESLRLFPPAPFTGRLVVKPTTLAGHDLPPGTEVYVSPYCTHRLPGLFPDPQRFRPERWETIDPSPHEYVPFGGGSRFCIGAGFATLEVKIALSLLLQRFTFELAPNARIDRKTTVVLSPRHGMPMILRPKGETPRAGAVRGNVREMVDLPS